MNMLFDTRPDTLPRATVRGHLELHYTGRWKPPYDVQQALGPAVEAYIESFGVASFAKEALTCALTSPAEKVLCKYDGSPYPAAGVKGHSKLQPLMPFFGFTLEVNNIEGYMHVHVWRTTH